MTGKPSPFKVIDGTPAPETRKERMRARLRKHPKPPSQIRCNRCTSIAVVEVKLGMELRNGKPAGGQKQIVCALCLAQGEYVVLA
ncbi:MAG: hypothetical protein ACOY4K_06470 [Pseudomonadota bacterium]